MKKNLEKIRMSLERLLNSEATVCTNFEVLDNNIQDFNKVTRLYKIYNTDAVEIATEIVNKLKLGNANYYIGHVSVMSLYSYIYDTRNHKEIFEILNKKFKSENIDDMILLLNDLASEREQLLKELLPAA